MLPALDGAARFREGVRSSNRNFRPDARAFAWGGLDREFAPDHVQPFPHAEQSQPFVLFGMQRVSDRKPLPLSFIVMQIGAIQLLDLHLHSAGVRVTADVIERFLRDAIEHGSTFASQLLHRRQRRTN